MRDIVGLFLNPPQHAVIFCVDERRSVYALERPQPNLPMGLGYVEGYTRDYTRHGTTTRFAALEVATGHVQAAGKARHRRQGFLALLKAVERELPARLAMHVIPDNFITHKLRAVRRWVLQHPRVHLHFTPTYSS